MPITSPLFCKEGPGEFVNYTELFDYKKPIRSMVLAMAKEMILC